MNTILRPFLVIPKLIEQPTWGGTYIAETKRWSGKSQLKGVKIGQSYELYDKSNLSMAVNSDDPEFNGELTDAKQVEQQTSLKNSIPLSRLISENPKAILGSSLDKFGPVMPLLLKFTQALGNSFQLHIKDGTQDVEWKAKPESWYYFEPGLITLGVKPNINWDDYKHCVFQLNEEILQIAAKVKSKSATYEEAKDKISTLIKTYNPWQFVNVVEVANKSLIDLSPCGIHHSWEEDLNKIPLGNVLFEIQLNVMDSVSTIRNFDKGKMDSDGNVRPLQIEEYFKYVDRSEEANKPDAYKRKPTVILGNDKICHERLFGTKYYTLDKVKFKVEGAEFVEKIDRYRHFFVKEGAIKLSAGNVDITLQSGHSAIVPAAATEYAIRATETGTNVLISY